MSSPANMSSPVQPRDVVEVGVGAIGASPAGAIPIGVAVIGFGSVARYIHEQLALRRDFTATTRPTDDDPASAWDAAINEDSTRLLYLTEPCEVRRIADAIRARKHLVIQPGMIPSATELRHLAELAAAHDTIAVVDEPRRWDEDFRNARSLVAAGVLGTLQRIRLAIHERSLPGEVFPQGVLRDLGGHWLDQLLALVNDEPAAVHLRKFHSPTDAFEQGFLTRIDFAGGASAVVELQTQSLLSLRTGWMLEGTAGAYRNGRLYTLTADGEIIDEPVAHSPDCADPFFDALSAAIQGDRAARSLLADLHHAARVDTLIANLLDG